MKALGYLFLIVASVILYATLAMGAGIYQRFPIPHFLIMAVGLFFLVRLIRAKFSIWRLICLTAGIALSGLFAWWTLSYSNYPAHTSPVAVGEKAAVMSLEFPNSTGENSTLASQADDANGTILLAFFRGYW